MNQPASSSATASQTGDNTFLNQAQQWLSQGNLNDMFRNLPTSFKNVGTSINKLSTTQKIVGGSLLALGVGYLVARKGNGRAATRDQAATLHELLYFVNDRIEGYQRAVEESKDAQLRGYYKQLVSQSQRFANELNDYLRRQGEGRETGTTLKGKLYRGWMEVKAALTGRDENAILGSNIYGEEWALKAYQDALDDHTLSGSLRQAVERQYELSQQTYRELKRLESQQQKH